MRRKQLISNPSEVPGLHRRICGSFVEASRKLRGSWDFNLPPPCPTNKHSRLVRPSFCLARTPRKVTSTAVEVSLWNKRFVVFSLHFCFWQWKRTNLKVCKMWSTPSSRKQNYTETCRGSSRKQFLGTCLRGSKSLRRGSNAEGFVEARNNFL